eukprot:9856881-Alexandrium_andersonii.AAC.1
MSASLVGSEMCIRDSSSSSTAFLDKRAIARGIPSDTRFAVLGRHRRVYSGGSTALPALQAGSGSFELFRA